MCHVLYYSSCTGFPLGNSFDVFHNCHSSASSRSLMFWQVIVLMRTSSVAHYTSWRKTEKMACVATGRLKIKLKKKKKNHSFKKSTRTHCTHKTCTLYTFRENLLWSSFSATVTQTTLYRLGTRDNTRLGCDYGISTSHPLLQFSVNRQLKTSLKFIQI